MARFTFAKSRKKAPPQLVLAEPMSKAHKILGSTPMSIDSPKPWDDASSGFSGGTGASTVPSYISTEDSSSDHHVAIAPSDDDWTNESDILPAIIESNGLDSDTDKSLSDIAHSVRKTQSSSTIRSWYDKSKQPMSIAQQTSALAMCKGVPSKVHQMLDLESPTTDPRMKKKPPMLDFSNLRTASRLSRKGTIQLRTDGTVADDPDSAGRSPSMLNLMPSTGKGRRIQKRNTKDSMLSPAVAEERPHTAGSSRRRGSSTREIPSLYDHYEQMTLRQLMQSDRSEERKQEEEQRTAEKEKPIRNQKTNEGSYQALGGSPEMLWLNDSLPTTPQTPFTTGLTPAAAQQRSNSVASKLTATSRRSRSTTPVERPDLKETSMLMLSSDSEDDVEPAPSHKSQKSQKSQTSQTRSSISSQPASTASISPRTVSRSQSSRAPSQASDHRPIRNSKRASFASANTYITIPNSSRLSTDTAIRIPLDSRSSTPYTEGGPSCRTSLMSNLSSASVLQNSTNYIQEAKAVTMVAGRRPSRVEYREDDTPGTSSSAGLPPVARTLPSLTPSLPPTAPEQLTPPLSPSSVDFYIRSARSSIDGPGSQNRYMAVTRQEELLLAALRQKKQQHSKKKSVGMAEERPQNFTQETSNETDEDDESTQETEATSQETMFDFGFPAPPTARKPTFFDNAISTSASISSLASTANTDMISQDSLYEDHESTVETRLSSLAPAPSTQPPLRGILKRPNFQHQEPEQHDVMLFLDDTEPEPSPDMTDFSEFGYLAMPSLQSEHSDSLRSNSPLRDMTPSQVSSSSSRSVSEGKRVDRSYRSPSAMASVPEHGELEHHEEDIPRPDSPISPDAFPAVPQIRTTLSSMARLSAVGPAPMINEPGWWGDDD